MAEHDETWHALVSAGQLDSQGDHHTPKPFVRQAFRKYLDAGSLPTALPGRGACPRATHDAPWRRQHI